MVGRYKVKGELKVLGMKEGGRFSFSDVKEAFRMQLAEQPDPTMAQVVTDAAMVLFQFLVDNPGSGEEAEEEDKALLKEFEEVSEVEYKKGSVLFKIKEEKVDKWIKCFTDYFGFEGDTKESYSVLFKVPDWSVTLSEEEKVPGSVTVHVYPAGSEHGPRVLVQGTLWLSFATLVLPRIANTLGLLEGESAVKEKEIVKEMGKEEDTG